MRARAFEGPPLLDLCNSADTLQGTNHALNLLLMHYVYNAYVTLSIIPSGTRVSLSLSSFIHGYRRYPRVSTRAYARKLKLSRCKHHCITGNYDSARNIVSCLTGRYRTGVCKPRRNSLFRFSPVKQYFGTVATAGYDTCV